MTERAYIDPKVLKQLSVLKPWRTVLAIAGDWVIVGLAIAISQYFQNAVAYVAAVIVIGGRQQALGALMHEFAHYRFVNNKAVSEWVGDLFVAWPIMAGVDAYRNNHLAHHRYTNTDQDPDWVVTFGTRKFTFPQEWQSIVVSLVGYLAIVGSLFDMVEAIQRLAKLDRSTRTYKVIRLVYYAAFAVVFTLTGTWLQFLLYWVVPFMTVFFCVLYIRGVAEHFGSMDYSDELGSTRTVIPFFWENWLISPHRVNYHLDHHLYPSVPFYNLPELHRTLVANPDYAARAHVTRGYSVGLVRECLAQPSTSAA